MSHEVPPELSFEDLWYEYLFRAHKFFEASLGLARGELGAVMDGSLRLAPKGDAIDQRIRIDQAARNSRHAVLFTSLGAEAYINAVSAEQLSNRDADAVDRLDPGSKWHLIPRLAFGREVFDPAREPLQSVTTLFKARNRLVHAKRGEWVAMGDLFTDEMLQTFAVVADPDDVAGMLRARFGPLVDRIGFDLPYRADPDALKTIIAKLKD